jgi:hypothetical protein
MTEAGPSLEDQGMLRVYVVLARGAAQPVTVVTAANASAAARAFQRVSRERAAVGAQTIGPILIAKVPPAAMPRGDASAASWLMAVACSPGMLALVTSDEAATIS